jgi:hypothetical protein
MKAFAAISLCAAAVVASVSVPVFAKAIRASVDPVKDEPAITEKERQHWAFVPLGSPALPQVAHQGVIRNEVDRFIESGLEKAGLMLLPQADPATLLRRVTFDLIGLPPAEADVAAFVANPSDDAYAAYVDKLLASPQYGEAAAQPWLDLARFAETDGFEHDIERKHAWKYRDWVISALNRDMPFDAFVRNQIAGDKLEGGEAAATGFLLSGPDMPDINNQDERRHFVLNDMTSTVGSVFLGLTMSCAQCHDHPYDAVSQADFYRLRAFFDSLPSIARDRQLGPEMRDAEGPRPVSHAYVRGDVKRKGPEVQPGYPRIANPRGDAAGDSRATLAEWLATKENAPFLRVAVNRLWQQHFGKGLAATSSDFGKQGDKPTHPELLDWLAAELPRQGWSLKTMHRMIVLSATYRQQSVGKSEAWETALAKDPENKLYSRMPRKRLTGEAIRDAMLFTSGHLNPKAGGPSVRLPLPAEVSNNLLKKQREDVTKDATEHARRSVYAFSRRNLRYPLFDLFDRPDALLSCARRGESTTAPQALLLFNSEVSQETAEELAKKVMRQSGGESAPETLAKVTSWVLLSREPTREELKVGAAFLQKHTAHAETLQQGLADYCLAMLNSNAFVWVD